MRKRVFTRGLAVLLGLLGALGAFEAVMRVARPYNVQRAGTDLPLFDPALESSQELYVSDDELGFRPVLGSVVFDPTGVRHHPYGERPREGVERVLFLGDSVTFRAKILNALQARYGDEDFEYLNAGVEAYNTSQEVLYFERYARKNEPHHVVLTFHHNDFETTPIAFRDGEGRLRVVAPSKHHSQVNPWLFTHSHLYRYWIGSSRTPVEVEARHSIRTALRRLKDLTEEAGMKLTVLVFPPLKPLEEWTEAHHRRHTFALDTMAELRLRHFDLLPGLREALDAGIEYQESPGDLSHPNDALAEIFARRLAEAGLLAGR